MASSSNRPATLTLVTSAVDDSLSSGMQVSESVSPGIYQSQGISQTDGSSLSNAGNSPVAATSSMSHRPTKRKRLAKACDMCHKSKRRCCGTAPCANCVFAGKPCTYTNSSGVPVPAPRGNATDGRRDSYVDSGSFIVRSPLFGDAEGQIASIATPTTTQDTVSPLDVMFTRELVHLFFAHCHPLTSILHQPSFLLSLSQAQVPRYLLLSMFAVAVPYSLRPTLRTTPTWHAGERFAVEAKRLIFDNVDDPRIREGVDGLRVKPSLELAQALCLLQTHERVMKAHTESDRLLKLTHAVLDALDIFTLESQDDSLHHNFVRIEALRRVFWHLHCIELLSPRAGENMRDRRERAGLIRLPLEDALFDMPRIESRAGFDSPYEYLPLPAGPKSCRSEFGNLIRVCEIYAAILDAIATKEHVLRVWEQGVSATLDGMPSVSQQEMNLRRWLELLPDHLRLTEDNLQFYLSQLDGAAGSSAGLFIMMHGLAESSVIALHAFAEMGSASPATATRQQKAVANLTMILTAMGCRGRVKFMMSTLLATLGQSLSAQHPQVLTWFDEYYRMWGVTYEELMNGHLRAFWRKTGPLSPAILLGNQRAVDGQRAFSSMSGTSSESIQSIFDAEKAMGDPLDYADMTLRPASATGQQIGSIYAQGDGMENLRQVTRPDTALSASGRSQASLDDDSSTLEITRFGNESLGTLRNATLDVAFGDSPVGAPLSAFPSGGPWLNRRAARSPVPTIPRSDFMVREPGLTSRGAIYPELSSDDSDSQSTSPPPPSFSTTGPTYDDSMGFFRRAPAIIVSGMTPVPPSVSALQPLQRRKNSSPLMLPYNGQFLEDEDMGLNW